MKSLALLLLSLAPCSAIRLGAVHVRGTTSPVRASHRCGRPVMDEGGSLISPLQIGVAAVVGVGFPALIFGVNAAIDATTGGATKLSEDPYAKYPTMQDIIEEDARLGAEGGGGLGSLLDSAGSLLGGLPGLGDGRGDVPPPSTGEQPGPFGAASGLFKSLTGETEREAAADAATMQAAQQAAREQQRRVAEQAAMEQAAQAAAAERAVAANQAASAPEVAAEPEAMAVMPAAEAAVGAAEAEAVALEAAAAAAEAQQRAAEARLALARAKAAGAAAPATAPSAVVPPGAAPPASSPAKAARKKRKNRKKGKGGGGGGGGANKQAQSDAWPWRHARGHGVHRVVPLGLLRWVRDRDSKN
eukprot:CAMPEP_0119063494 /NCGR_PEP_ID=MMETSP1178-20130426/6821_1 /TAXON_ID=33656 /ORGANISM="unid sp, Strain CCMP2000" /LENGTH=358 /DNA_ID=CAMNT_0007044865 /DNA_START=22 /DNA_END=1099 /DNA_ORIENTATION=+